MYYVVLMETKFESLQDARSQSPDDLAAHVARSKDLHASGQVLLAGAFASSSSGYLETMAICSTREAAEDFAAGDPFVRSGMVHKWEIREWHDMFADLPRGA